MYFIFGCKINTTTYLLYSVDVKVTLGDQFYGDASQVMLQMRKQWKGQIGVTYMAVKLVNQENGLAPKRWGHPKFSHFNNALGA